MSSQLSGESCGRTVDGVVCACTAVQTLYGATTVAFTRSCPLARRLLNCRVCSDQASRR